MPDLTIIFNPLAGTANLASIVDLIGTFWIKQGWRIQIKATQYPGHAGELARQAAANNIDMVLAAGGDGTLGEIAGGLAFSETVMAPFPAGTGNSFAKELRMPRLGRVYHRGVEQACEALVRGSVHRSDIGRCGPEQFWLQWVGVGLDGFVVEHIEPRPRIVRRLGKVGYIAQGLPILFRFPGMNASAEIDGSKVKGDFLMITISNCRLYGGGAFLLSPKAYLDDGQMEIWMFRGKRATNVFQQVFSIMRHQHHRNPNIEFFKAQSISIRTDPELPFHRDGDPAGKGPFKAWIEPKAIKILIPTTAPNGLFLDEGTLLIDTIKY